VDETGKRNAAVLKMFGIPVSSAADANAQIGIPFPVMPRHVIIIHRPFTKALMPT
jgi:hypothetical protein